MAALNLLHPFVAFLSDCYTVLELVRGVICAVGGLANVERVSPVYLGEVRDMSICVTCEQSVIIYVRMRRGTPATLEE